MQPTWCEQFHNVGITLQAYLYRTEKDLAVALERPGKIRLVKGTFEEQPELARARGEKLDTFYKCCDEDAAGKRTPVLHRDT